MSDVEFKKLAKELAGKQRSSSSILLLVVITLILVAVIWAAITELDNVVRGSGKTVSEAQNQMVQSSEPGVKDFSVCKSTLKTNPPKVSITTSSRSATCWISTS